MLEVCVLEDMHSTCLCIMCVNRIGSVFHVSVGKYIHISLSGLHVWQMHYGVRVLHSQHSMCLDCSI
jgi:hypothetical protein